MRYDYEGIDYDISKKACNHSNYIDIATNAAMKSTMIQKHGCVVVHKNKIVSIAHNIMPTYYNESLHAEINAIIKAKKKIKHIDNAVLYIVRIGQNSMNNPLKYSKPCTKCTNFIINSGIKKVYYSTNYEKISNQEDKSE
jgi:deoxycytidylate deaminase